MHKTQLILLLVALAFIVLTGCSNAEEPEVARVSATEAVADAPTIAKPTDVPTEQPTPTDVPVEATEPAGSDSEAETDFVVGEVVNGLWPDAGNPYPDPDLALIGVTGQPQFVNAYTNW